MKPILIIHAGVHKTGSTALQEYCFEHQPELADQGILYPSYGLRHDYGVGHRHVWLREAMYRYCKGGENEWTELLSEAKKLPVTIVSHENFLSPFELKKKVWRYIHEHFDVKLVVYLRPQIQYFNAKYKEWVRRLRFQGEPSDFVLQHFRYGLYHEQLLRWADVIGWQNIAVRKFETSVLEKGDLVADFFATIDDRFGIAVGGNPQGAKHNESLGNKSTLALMLRNRLDRKRFTESKFAEATEVALSYNSVSKPLVIAKDSGLSVLELVKKDQSRLLDRTGVDLKDTPYKRYGEYTDFSSQLLRQSILKDFKAILKKSDK